MAVTSVGRPHTRCGAGLGPAWKERNGPGIPEVPFEPQMSHTLFVFQLDHSWPLNNVTLNHMGRLYADYFSTDPSPIGSPIPRCSRVTTEGGKRPNQGL